MVTWGRSPDAVRKVVCRCTRHRSDSIPGGQQPPINLELGWNSLGKENAQPCDIADNIHFAATKLYRQGKDDLKTTVHMCWFVVLVSFCATCFSVSSNTNAGLDNSMLDDVRLSEILVKTPQPYTATQLAMAEQRALQALSEIERKGSFADIARRSSEDPSAQAGGDLGCFTRGKLAPALGKLVFDMKIGEVSNVIRTKQGFVILEVTGRGSDACSPLQPLTPITADLKPYLEILKKKVEDNWYKQAPQSARVPELRHGKVVVDFSVQRNGALTDATVASTSGDSDLDKAALTAVHESSPLSPVPSTIQRDHLRMRFNFEYNPSRGL